MENLLSYLYLEVGIQGLLVAGLLIWRFWALIFGVERELEHRHVKRKWVGSAPKVTLLTGMIWSWIPTSANNLYWFAWRELGRPEWLSDHYTAMGIKVGHIVGSLFHIYTFTAWRFGVRFTVIWVVLSFGLPAIIFFL